MTENIRKKLINNGNYAACKLINKSVFFSNSRYPNAKTSSSSHVHSIITSSLMKHLDVHSNIYQPPLFSCPMRTLHFTM